MVDPSACPGSTGEPHARAFPALFFALQRDKMQRRKKETTRLSKKTGGSLSLRAGGLRENRGKAGFCF